MRNSPSKTKPAQPHGVRYPWDSWFNKGKFTLVRGKDFVGLPHGILRTAKQAATARKIHITGSIESVDGVDRVTITVNHDGVK